jgi:hypothetical protein
MLTVLPTPAPPNKPTLPPLANGQTRIAIEHSGYSVFAGVGERTREGNDFYHEMKESNVLDKVSLVYGQMSHLPVLVGNLLLKAYVLTVPILRYPQD